MLYFFALYQGFRLLDNIDANDAFSDLSVNALKNIKVSAFAISIVLATFMPIVYYVADIDDAPGLILIGAAIVFTPIVISVFAALLERLLKEAIRIKSENDLTV
jgi:hypothetical protein